jgi:general secretion pathway protein H
MAPLQTQSSAFGKEAGFTLLELIVVLSIIAVMVLFTPRLTAGLPTVRLRSAAAALVEALRQARLDAIRTGNVNDVQIDTRQLRYAATGRQMVALEGSVDSMTARSDGPAEADIGSFRFYPDGSATGGQIVLQQNQRQATITVQWLTGRIGLAD